MQIDGIPHCTRLKLWRIAAAMIQPVEYALTNEQGKDDDEEEEDNNDEEDGAVGK